jgi:microcystin-dependent protein
LLPISQNTALFSLLGTNFGGNGTSNFALPNLQGRAPMGVGPGAGPGLSERVLGEMGGSESVTLLQTEMPAHSHGVPAQGSRADRANASGPVPAVSADQVYSTSTPSATLHPLEIGFAGSNQPHNNLQPLLTLNFCIALRGIFPARN